jgi:hypothetical protein
MIESHDFTGSSTSQGNFKTTWRAEELGLHAINMGHESKSVHRGSGSDFKPTPGLMSLFSKT